MYFRTFKYPIIPTFDTSPTFGFILWSFAWISKDVYYTQYHNFHSSNIEINCTLKEKPAEKQISDYCFSTSLLERNRVQKALIRVSLGNFKWVEAKDSDDWTVPVKKKKIKGK